MYSCPLCSSSETTKIAPKSFHNIQCLQNHLDSDHCPISKKSITKLVEIDQNNLENEIKYCIRIGLGKIENFRTSNLHENYANFDISKSKFNRSKIDLDDQIENLKLENNYLNIKLQNTKLNLNQFERRFEEKNQKLIKLIQFLQKSSFDQKMAKMELSQFLDDLLDDMENKELELDRIKFQLNQWSRIKIPSDKMMEKDEKINDADIGSYKKLIRINSNMAADSGYEGMDSSDADGWRPRPLIRKKKFRHTKDTTVIGDEQEEQKLKFVLSHILLYLDTVDLEKCKLVCKTWRKSIDNDFLSIKNRLLIERKILSIDQFRILFDNANVRSLELINLKVKDSMEKGILEPLVKNLLRKCAEKLLFLKIIECSPYLTDRSLWLASCYSSNLSHVIYSTPDDTFAVTSPVVWSLGAGCRRLATFAVAAPRGPVGQAADGSAHATDGLTSRLPSSMPLLHFDDTCLLTAARCWSATLTRLCLDGRFISLSGIAFIGQHCSILQNLEIDNLSHILSLADCQFVFGNGFKCLKILILMQSQITADAVYNICGMLENLKKLRIIWKIFQIGNDQYDQTFLADLEKIQEFRENNQDMKDMISINVTIDR